MSSRVLCLNITKNSVSPGGRVFTRPRPGTEMEGASPSEPSRGSPTVLTRSGQSTRDELVPIQPRWPLLHQAIAAVLLWVAVRKSTDELAPLR